MEQNPVLTRRQIVVAIVALLFLILVWLLLNYTWVSFSYNSGGDAGVNIINPEDNVKQNEVALRQGQSKTVLLRRSTYKIQVEGGDKLSVYKKSLGFFRDSVETELIPQRGSEYIGRGVDFDCIIEEQNGDNIYYPCNRYVGAVEISRNGRLETIVDPAVADLDLFEHASPEALDESNTGFAIKPYLDGLISVASGNNSLYINQLRPSSGFENQAVIEVEDFLGQIDEHSVATIADGKTTRFLVLDKQKMDLLVFDGLEDKRPEAINLSDELGELSDGIQLDIFVSNLNQVKILVKDVGELESHVEEDGEIDILPEGSETLFGSVDQRLVTIDVGSGEIVQIDRLPRDLFVRRAEASPLGDLILLPLYSDQSPLFLPAADREVENDFFQAKVSEVCWIDDDSFYYLLGGKQIFRYSLSREASFLVYGGLFEGIINDIECNADQLYFSFDLTDESRVVDQELFGVQHYKLNDEPFQGQRVEGHVPLFVVIGGTGGDIVEVNIGPGNVLNITENLFAGSPPSKRAARQAIIQELQSKGVDTEGLRFSFGF